MGCTAVSIVGGLAPSRRFAAFLETPRDQRLAAVLRRLYTEELGALKLRIPNLRMFGKAPNSRLPNAIDGAARETRVHDKLTGHFKDASVQRERMLRTSDGKKAIDPLTGEGRRIDHAVIQNGEARYLVETTSKTADKAAQIAKEARIRANGGTFIRDKVTRELIDISNVPTRITRRK